MKYEVIAKTLSFISKLESTARPLGKIHESKIRYGTLPVKKKAFYATASFKRKLILLGLVYLAVGLYVAKRFLPSWKYNKLRVVLLWPLLILFRVLIGKLPS